MTTVSYGGIVAVQTSDCYYGIQGYVELPTKYVVQGVDKTDYFDAYFAFVNPYNDGDPRLEAGVFKYPSKAQDVWTFFTWAPRAGGWQQVDVPRPATGRFHFKLRFDPKYTPHRRGVSETDVHFFVDGVLRFTNRISLSKETFEKMGLKMKACIGVQNDTGTVSFDRIQINQLKVCSDKKGSQWSPMSNVGYKPITKPPSPTASQWMPLTASHSSTKLP